MIGGFVLIVNLNFRGSCAPYTQSSLDTAFETLLAGSDL